MVVPSSGLVTLALPNGQSLLVTIPTSLLQSLPGGAQLVAQLTPTPSGLNSVELGSLGGGDVTPVTTPMVLRLFLQDAAGHLLPLPDSLSNITVTVELPVLAPGTFAWLRELDVNGQFAGYVRDAATFDPSRNGLMISVPLSGLQNTLFLPAVLQPAYLANFDPNVHIWSGPTSDSQDFGVAGPQNTVFTVVGPQVLNRIYVYNPSSGNYGWIDVTGVGPVTGPGVVSPAAPAAPAPAPSGGDQGDSSGS